MNSHNQNLRSWGETQAIQYLKSRGLQILKRNLKTKLGEIDILARDQDVLVVVKVNTKSNRRLGSALEMVNISKLRKLTILALELQTEYQTNTVRIDVLAVDSTQNNPKIKHYKGLIEFVERSQGEALLI